MLKRSIILLVVLAICSIASQDAMAQADLGLKSVGVQVGLVSPENSDATAGFGACADLGTLAPRLRLVSHLDFWSQSQDSPFGATASVGDIALGARAEYLFPVSSPRLQPYAGGGLGLHFLHAEVDVPGFPTMESSSNRLGIDLGGGVAMPINPRTEFRSELWYGIVDSYSQLSLKAGVSFKVGS